MSLICRGTTLILTVLFLQGSLAGEEGSFLLDQKTFSLLREELSGESAGDTVAALAAYDRILGTRGYTDAARYILQRFHSYGFPQNKAWIESFPSDGRITYQSWQSPPGWSIESAQLRLISPRKEVLVTYPETPLGLIAYSNPGQVRAELLDVGAGTSNQDYEGKQVLRQLVLATGSADDVHRLAVLKYGAAGVLRYPDDEEASGQPDILKYSEIWPRTEELDRGAFGFNLTSSQGRRLKELLNKGTQVVLEAEVAGSGLEFGSLDVVVAVIPGVERPEQELVYISHLDRPRGSSRDNASGSGALLDIARSLKALIGEGRLPPPKRTLRFLWVPRLYGTMAYIDAHPEIIGTGLGGNILAALNLDMAGENPEMMHSRLRISWTPHSISSALPDIVVRLAEHVDAIEADSASDSPFNYRVSPFLGESDHVVLNDGMVAIPSVMLGHWSDYGHPSGEDTPHQFDPVALERSELIAAATFWYLANLSEEQSLELANLVAAKAQERLATDMRRATSWILDAPADRLEAMYNEGKRVLTFALEREEQALNSILEFASFPSTRGLVRTWEQMLENESQVKIRTLQVLVRQQGGNLTFSQEMTDPERLASYLVPYRLTRGPLAEGIPERGMTEPEHLWYENPEARSLDTYLLVNLIDGTRSILEIRNLLSAATQPISLSSVDRYIQDLAKAGVIELRRGN